MSDWDNYGENLAFDPNNSMPGVILKNLKQHYNSLKQF